MTGGHIMRGSGVKSLFLTIGEVGEGFSVKLIRSGGMILLRSDVDGNRRAEKT